VRLENLFTMNQNLSPKDLASVIGVSESSLKRWVDDGRLVASRTSGGHRRIPVHEAVRFIRETAQSVVRPDLLGLSDLTRVPVAKVTGGEGESALLAALEAGHAEQARGLILAHYLTTRTVASVCDGPIAHAMHRIGELWRHSEQGIAIEHRATTICVEALHNIRLLLPPTAEEAPVAVGGAIEGDPYTLPTLMAATCFRELGVRDMDLGANTPFLSLVETARRHRAKFVWISASAINGGSAGAARVVDALRQAAGSISEMGASLLLGGRAIYGLSLPQLPSTHVVHSMSELVSFARGARTKVAAPEVVKVPTLRAAAVR